VTLSKKEENGDRMMIIDYSDAEELAVHHFRVDHLESILGWSDSPDFHTGASMKQMIPVPSDDIVVAVEKNADDETMHRQHTWNAGFDYQYPLLLLLCETIVMVQLNFDILPYR